MLNFSASKQRAENKQKNMQPHDREQQYGLATGLGWGFGCLNTNKQEKSESEEAERSCCQVKMDNVKLILIYTYQLHHTLSCRYIRCEMRYLHKDFVDVYLLYLICFETVPVTRQ